MKNEKEESQIVKDLKKTVNQLLAENDEREKNYELKIAELK